MLNTWVAELYSELTLLEFDVVIVGGGHNGLVCGAYLAKTGLKVCVVERRPIVGGAAVTEELWPGFRISRASYVPSIMPQIVEDLKLTSFGLKMYPIDPQDFVPFPDRRFLFSFESHEKTAKEIEKFSKKDASNYLKFAEFAAKFVETVEPLFLAPPPRMSELLGLMQGTEIEEVIREILMTSCKDLLDEWFESEEVKAALCMHGVLNTSMGPDTIGTSYILANSVGKSKYKYAVGCTGAVSHAVASCLKAFGGKILVSSEVKRVLIQNGRAVGVELVTGEKIHSKAVVSNADPKRTFLKLVGADNLDQKFVNRVEHLNAYGTSFKINVALSEPLNFSAFPGTRVGPQHKALLNISPTVDYVQKAYDECKWGRIPSEPPISLFCQTAWDESVAPPNKHTLSIIAKYNPYHLANGNWKDSKEKALENALNVIESYAPNVRRSILHLEALSPLDLEQIFGLTEGNVTHLDQTLNQMLSFRPTPECSNYRTPILGLYLCGAGTHPGGGVTGAPGHNAAQAVIEDLRVASSSH
jgi:phytoene dehydrogenase-like protein